MRNSISLLTTLCFSLIGVTNILAQPEIQWEKSLGGTSLDARGRVQQTFDGGYIVASVSFSTDGDITNNYGSSDIWVVKLTPESAIEWQRNYGGSGADEVDCIKQTADGGYIIAGISSSNDYDLPAYNEQFNAWILKLNPNGDIEWSEILQGGAGGRASSISQLPSGDYILAGDAYSIVDTNLNMWVVKLDSYGGIIWEETLGGSGSDGASEIKETSDNGFIVSGSSFSDDGDVSQNNGIRDCWIVKLDGNGLINWKKSIGGSETDVAHSIEQTSDGGYVVAVTSNSSDGDFNMNYGESDIWILKLNGMGEMQWKRQVGGSLDERACRIKQTSDGGYLMLGGSISNDYDVSGNHGMGDYWLVKLDVLGNIMWQKTLGGSDADGAQEFDICSDGGIIISGNSRSNDGDVSSNHGDWDTWVVKLNCPLQISCPTDITVSNDPGTCGAVVNYLPPSQLSVCTDVNVVVTSGPESGQIFPIGTTTISFLATDATGSTASCSFTVTVTSDLTADAGSDQVVIIDSGPGPDPYPCDTLESNVSGGTPPYTYSWSPATGLSDPNAATTDVCPTVTTTYTLTVTDANGCESTDEVTVTVIDIDDTGSLPLVGNNNNKVYVCHLATCTTVEANVQANCNSPHSLCAHLAHGDELGECTCKNGSGEGDPHVHDWTTQLNAYPNPFTNTTTLTFKVEQDCRATLSVFDITGKEVARPFDGAATKEKLHIATLDGTGLGSGIYFYTLKTDSGESFTRKLVLSR